MEEIYRGYTIKVVQDEQVDDIFDWGDFTNWKHPEGLEAHYVLVWHRNFYNIRDKWGGPEDVLAWAKENRYWVLNLHLYEHSGRAWSLSPFGCRWDSGQAGYFLVSKKAYRLRKSAVRYAEGLLRHLNAVERGDVYGYTVHDPSGEGVDSCWGFIGDWEYCLTAAKESVDHELDDGPEPMLPGMTIENLLANNILALPNKT